ncbi:MAG TPA: hypothetical protein VD908_01755 [Cytophagales bacterium]|nr:hypothetical protein [Cytophagales bacterium]
MKKTSITISGAPERDFPLARIFYYFLKPKLFGVVLLSFFLFSEKHATAIRANDLLINHPHLLSLEKVFNNH